MRRIRLVFALLAVALLVPTGLLVRRALDRLGEAGFDPVYGARPLKRAIRAQLENPLAQEILAGRFHPGQTIKVCPDLAPQKRVEIEHTVRKKRYWSQTLENRAGHRRSRARW